MEKRKSQPALTLIELLIVIGIILILVGIAVPNYSKAKERALGKEAIASLKLIQAAEKIYRMEHQTYYPNSGIESNVTNINNNLKLFLTETNWDYNITGGSNTSTAYAYRQGLSCLYTLTHNDTDGEPNPTNCP